jgi:hypothetical protein
MEKLSKHFHRMTDVRNIIFLPSRVDFQAYHLQQEDDICVETIDAVPPSVSDSISSH